MGGLNNGMMEYAGRDWKRLKKAEIGWNRLEESVIGRNMLE